MALGPDHVRGTHRSAEGTSATFGAVAAAASLARLDERGMRHALSYAAQQVSGIWSWTRDNEHIEKAFDFGGMGARNGVTAALMVQSGFTGVDEVLDGEHNMIDALSTEPRPEQMIAGLGSRFFVTETAIKTFSVGYPIQAPLDALLTLRRQHGLTADNVDPHRRPAARRRCPHRQRQRDARRQLSVHPCRRAARWRCVVRRQPFARADEGPAGARCEAACASSLRIGR